MNDGSSVTISTDANTVVRIGHITGSLSYLQAGVHVEVKVPTSTGVASFIEARFSDVFTRYCGTIASIDTTTNTITLTLHNGSTASFTTDANTVFRFGWRLTGDITYLQAGVHVSAIVLTATGVAVQVQAREEDVLAHYHGTVTTVDTTNNLVTLTLRDGSTVTFSVGSGTTITINHQSDVLSDLVTGMHAQATVIKATNVG